MDFQKEAKIMCDLLGIPDETSIRYIETKLEMAYMKGELKSLDEFKKMGTPMESLDNGVDFDDLTKVRIKNTESLDENTEQ